jgi:polyferredoxin
MSGEYSMPCQRCPKRNAVQGKIDSTLACLVFAAATGRDAREVRLCGTCLRTVDSLAHSVAKSKTRKRGAWRGS